MAAGAGHLELGVLLPRWATHMTDPWCIDWMLSGGRQSGSFILLHVVSPSGSAGLTEAWFYEGASKTTLVKRTRSSVQALTEPPFCTLLANVSLVETSHMAKHRVNVGRDYTPQGHGYWEVWFLGSHIPLEL